MLGEGGVLGKIVLLPERLAEKGSRSPRLGQVSLSARLVAEPEVERIEDRNMSASVCETAR
jgi:hypothetical protein